MICGGTGARYLETVAKGALNSTSHVIRQSAVADGGMVGVLRNPVTVEYLKKNAAVGAISQALDIGKAFSQCKNGAEFVAFLEEHYDAKVLARGKITNYELKMDGGYDIGHLDVTGEEESTRSASS